MPSRYVVAIASFAVAYGGLATCARGEAVARSARAVATCDIVTAAEITEIVGLALQAADDASRSAGICFFTTRAVSEDGSASYAIVRNDDLPARRAFFAALARSCAGVSASAASAAMCASYAKLAVASDLQAYFDARTNGGTAAPVAGLGDEAFATDTALYVRRRSFIVEAIVKRGDTFDLARTTSLATLVVERSAP